MTDEELIARAREVGMKLRHRDGDLDRLAGWLMLELAGRLAAAGVTDADRRLVTRAREMHAAGSDTGALRVIASRPATADGMVRAEALAVAQHLLGELAAVVERLDAGGPVPDDAP